MTDAEKLGIKKMLLRLEGDPEQVDIYLKTLRNYKEADEAIAYAWEVIERFYEPSSTMKMESMGIVPDYEENPEDEGPAVFRDPDEDDEEEDLDRNHDDDDDDNEDEEDNRHDDYDDEAPDDEENEDDENPPDEEDEEDEPVVERPPKMKQTSDNTVSVLKGETPVNRSDDEDVPVEEEKELAGVGLPPAGIHTDAVIPEAPLTPLPETPLADMRQGVIKEAGGNKVIVVPEGMKDQLNAGPVYVLPADTGREAEIRIMELRIATNENLELARKIHEEIARSVAEERKIRDSMVLIVGAYSDLTKQLTENAQQASEIRQKLLEGTTRAERFMNEDMSRMLQQRAQEATNNFYQESKDHYNELFKAAVRRYKQFTEAAMDFQDKMSDENARQVRTIVSKVGMVQKVGYAILVLLLALIGITVVFKMFL